MKLLQKLRRNLQPSKTAPTTAVDVAATVAFLRAAKTSSAAERHLAHVLATAQAEAQAAGWEACRVATAASPLMHQMLYDLYLRGRRDGARTVHLPADFAPALATAMKAAAASQPPPVVNVAAPSVTVENTVEVPQRTIRATQQKDGSVLMTPQ